MYVWMYYNHGRSTSRVAITVQSQGQVKTDMQGQVTVITHMIQRSLTCRYPIYIENTTTYNSYIPTTCSVRQVLSARISHLAAQPWRRGRIWRGAARSRQLVRG